MIFWITLAISIIYLSQFLSVKWKLYNYLLANFKSPPRVPLLGSLLLFPMNMPGIFRKFLDFQQQYGNNYVLMLPFWDGNLVIADAKDAETLLGSSNSKSAKKARFYRFLEPWLGTGLLTADGNKWFSRRKIITPSFHFNMLEGYVEVMHRQSDILITKMKEQVATGLFDVYPMINAYALDVICEASMGVVVNAQDDPLSDYVKSVKDISTALIERNTHPLGKFEAYNYMPSGRRLKHLITKMHSFTDKIIKERRNQLLTKSKASLSMRLNFLDNLLHATIDGIPLTDNEIREEVDTFMFGGHDTAASGISFTLYLLAKYPDIQDKVYQELMDVFRSKDEIEITMKKLNELTYLDMAIKESLRILPPVPGIGRELTEETVINGVKVPAGVNIWILIYGIHHDPDIYPDPEKFDPERFNSSNCQSRRPYSYVPFSAGGRNCVGQKFGLYSLKTSLAKILINFKVLPGPDVILQSDIILKATNGILISLCER